METSIEKSQLKKIPNIRPGDSIRVAQRIKEGEKERVSTFEGLVIARKHGAGATATITVRKVIDGIGVERVFPVHGPMFSFTVQSHSKVRRAKLYYIREKAAREVRRKMKKIWSEPAAPEEAPAEPSE